MKISLPLKKQTIGKFVEGIWTVVKMENKFNNQSEKKLSLIELSVRFKWLI